MRLEYNTRGQENFCPWHYPSLYGRLFESIVVQGWAEVQNKVDWWLTESSPEIGIRTNLGDHVRSSLETGTSTGVSDHVWLSSGTWMGVRDHVVLTGNQNTNRSEQACAVVTRDTNTDGCERPCAVLTGDTNTDDRERPHVVLIGNWNNDEWRSACEVVDLTWEPSMMHP